MRLGSNAGASMPAPTITSVPPRLSWWKPASMALRLPEHSNTTSTAPSAIRSGSHIGNVSITSGPTTTSAPRARASCWRAAPGSTTVIGPMPRATSTATVNAPIGPAPNTMALSWSVMCERVMPCSATASGSARAASRSERPSGRANSEAAFTSV